MPEPYERLPDESARAYEAFCLYRDSGPSRSLLKVAQECTKSEALLKRWSAKHAWQARARAYDEHTEAVTRAAYESSIPAMAERHVQAAMAFQEKVAERLKNFDPSELTPSELIRWFAESVKLERLSRGVPDSHVLQEQTGTVQVDFAAEQARVQAILASPELTQQACQMVEEYAHLWDAASEQ